MSLCHAWLTGQSVGKETLRQLPSHVQGLELSAFLTFWTLVVVLPTNFTVSLGFWVGEWMHWHAGLYW